MGQENTANDYVRAAIKHQCPERLMESALRIWSLSGGLVPAKSPQACERNVRAFRVKLVRGDVLGRPTGAECERAT